MHEVTERIPYDGSIENEAQVKADRRAIQCMKDWASQQPECVMAAYTKWLDYENDEVDRKERSLKETGRDDSANQAAKFRAEMADSVKYAKQIKAGTPVKCEQ